MQNDLVLIFDLDGTLIDSFDQIRKSVNWVRLKFGVSLLRNSEVNELIGLPAKFLFQDLCLEETTLQEFVLSFRERLRFEILNGNEVFEGVHDFLCEMKVLGFRLCVATSKPQELAELVVRNSELKELVDLVSGTGQHKPKPDPGVIAACIQDSGRSFAVMIGDRPEDIYAATTLGIPSVGIAQGVFSEVDLLRSGANVAFENFIKFHNAVNDFPGGPVEYFQQLCG